MIGAVAATSFHPPRRPSGVVDGSCSATGRIRFDAATRVVGRVGDDPVLALRAIREALVLPYASLSSGGAELASSGTAVTHVRRLALQLGDDEVGEIVVGLRPGDLTLSAGDERVLRIVVPLLAQTLRARSLAADLRPHAARRSPRSRRNDAGCDATCTTASGPTLSGSRSRRMPPEHAA